jgi:hypothetical protein
MKFDENFIKIYQIGVQKLLRFKYENPMGSKNFGLFLIKFHPEGSPESSICSVAEGLK